jgi:NADP-dependent 3-hydroxy acid dehydrogenase YdfG
MKLARDSGKRKEASARSPALAGKVVIITGASSGIGAATAWEIARRGAHVVLAARREQELEAKANAINAAGYHAVAVPTDVTDAAQVQHLTERTLEMFGQVDVLVNNAGMAWRESFQDNSTGQIEQIVDVNLLGAILLTHAVLPGMLERRRGVIISVGSVAAHIPVDPLYCATKFGLRGFSLSLHRELLGSGVAASIVSPGFVSTPMNMHMHLPMPGPEIVARAIANLALHPRREVVVPAYYRPIMAGEHLLPWVADRIIRWTRRRVIPLE